MSASTDLPAKIGTREGNLVLADELPLRCTKCGWRNFEALPRAAADPALHGGVPMMGGRATKACDREAILDWGRTTGLLREVVQHYRFERRQGADSAAARSEAARLIEQAGPWIDDPIGHAGIMIEWAESEHRAWFWRCCRDNHVL